MTTGMCAPLQPLIVGLAPSGRPAVSERLQQHAPSFTRYEPISPGRQPDAVAGECPHQGSKTGCFRPVTARPGERHRTQPSFWRQEQELSVERCQLRSGCSGSLEAATVHQQQLTSLAAAPRERRKSRPVTLWKCRFLNLRTAMVVNRLMDLDHRPAALCGHTIRSLAFHHVTLSERL
jgi:hypothetical protein